MAVLWTFRAPSLGRHVRRELLRNALFDFTTLIPATACHQSNYVETYSRYSAEEYPQHIGWGHSALPHTLAFATLTGVKHLVPFHHDPAHTDVDLDRLITRAVLAAQPAFTVTPGTEGATFDLRAPMVPGGAEGRR